MYLKIISKVILRDKRYSILAKKKKNPTPTKVENNLHLLGI